MRIINVAALCISFAAISPPVEAAESQPTTFYSREKASSPSPVSNDTDTKSSLAKISAQIEALQKTQETLGTTVRSESETLNKNLQQLIELKASDLKHQIDDLDKLVYALIGLLVALLGGAIYVGRELSSLSTKVEDIAKRVSSVESRASSPPRDLNRFE